MNDKINTITTNLSGDDLLHLAALNKGTAFTAEERIAFGLLGKLPPKIETLAEQATRAYQQFKNQPTKLAQHTFLNDLHNDNETLFYKLITEHLPEMMPIVYTPVVGEAIQKFSAEYRRPRGIFISYPNKDKIAQILDNYTEKDIEVILVTDSGGILGIGDQGVGGINICIGKLAVYTLCAGLNPHKMLPVVLDVGTNNETLLNDPQYLGWKHPRITGKDYDDFIDAFVTTVQKKFPNVFLHWEDFARDTARKNLDRYRDKICTFNDDMQGTGAVVLAALLSATKILGQKLSEQRIVFFGAGTSATGIADQICDSMVREGSSMQEARDRVYLLGRRGLITNDLDKVTPFQKIYAKDVAWQGKDLLSVVQQAKPTVLIGVSTVGGSFTEEIVKTMAKNAERPIIFPLSNPTDKSEAIPADIMQWTSDKALVATGSPFDGVSQCNNAFVFPGIGLGVMAVKAKRLTDEMIWAGCRALAECSPTDSSSSLLPGLGNIQEVSHKVAIAVAKQAIAEGLAKSIDVEKAVNDAIWEPKYFLYKKS
jgi:malate dehydrogenase (oxaloacetate-decarboxylating)